MPGANRRAMQKAQSLDSDAVILDLEDAVAPSSKADARAAVVEAVATGDFGFREVLVRINAFSTDWGIDDLEAMRGIGIDGVVIPKVEEAADVERALEAGFTVWVMIETPRGVLGLDRLLAEVESIPVVVMGTSDLLVELHANEWRALEFARSQCLLIARAHGREILDGVHLEFRDVAAFRSACLESRALGFDGKTLIHPTQIEPANEAFGVSAEEAEGFRAVLDAWDEALAAGRGVAELDGRLIENLHAAEARRGLARFDAAQR